MFIILALSQNNTTLEAIKTIEALDHQAPRSWYEGIHRLIAGYAGQSVSNGVIAMSWPRRGAPEHWQREGENVRLVPSTMAED